MPGKTNAWGSTGSGFLFIRLSHYLFIKFAGLIMMMFCRARDEGQFTFFISSCWHLEFSFAVLYLYFLRKNLLFWMEHFNIFYISFTIFFSLVFLAFETVCQLRTNAKRSNRTEEIEPPEHNSRGETTQSSILYILRNTKCSCTCENMEQYSAIWQNAEYSENIENI